MGIMDKLFGGADPGISSTATPPPIAGNGTGRPSVANPTVQTTNTNSNQTTVQLPNGNNVTFDADGNIIPVGESGEKKSNSPLDAFATLWDTPKDKDGKPIAPAADPLDANVFNFDPAKIKQQAATLDFVKDINPELITRFQAGGTDGAAAFTEIINTVQQSAFAAATLNVGNLVNAAMKKNNAALRTALPSSIRAAQLQDTPLGDNPVLSHPAVAPLITALRSAAFQKNPNANPADVTKQINDYVLGLSKAVMENDPAVTSQKQQLEEKATNWGNFLNS